MGPKTPVAQSSELFRQSLCEMLNAKYPLVKMADVIEWDEIERSFGAHFQATTGRPALSPRLVAGLLYLQHAHDCSDEAIVNTWVENPYVQYFTGETYFQTEATIDSSSLTRWRKRIGEEGVETLLMVSIDTARRIGMMKASSMDRVIVDTTVMPKAIAHPTDSWLLEKSRQHLVNLATDNNIALRQNYNLEAPMPSSTGG
jgi:IS5 family transposase